ncbi:MAG: hypothetical protein QXG16_02085 [Candidatus Anstonellaceae archaeon]
MRVGVNFLFLLLSLFYLVALVDGSCIPGSSYCANFQTMMLCQDGTGYIPITCVAGCDFNSGKCRTLGPDSCTIQELGARRCSPTNPNMPQFCDGSFWQDDPPECTYGCDPTRGDCFECRAGDPPYCSGDILVSCVNGRREFKDCKSLGLVCDNTAKACVASQVDQCKVAGEVICNSQRGVLEICMQDPVTKKLSLQLFDDCNGFGCDPTSNSCFECRAGDPPYCSGDILVSCVNGRREFKDCKSLGLVCDNTAKACVASQVDQCKVAGEVICNSQRGVLEICMQDPVTKKLSLQLFDDCNGFGCDPTSNSCFECRAGDPPYCSGDILVSCVNGWRNQVNCVSGCYQKDQKTAYCKICTQPNFNQCVDINSYVTCTQDFVWSNPIFCPAGKICSSGNCVDPSQNQGGQGGGGSGGSSASSSAPSGGVSYSGGGEVKPCVSYSEWFVNSTKEFKKDNKTCVELTYVSYCVKADGTVDNYRYKTNSSIECYEEKKQPICNYVFSRSESYIDNSTSPGKCRNCTKEIFYYSCDGIQDVTNKKEVSSCSDFYPCTTEEEKKKDEYEQFISTYWPILLLLLIVGMAVLGYYLWKSSEQKEQQEN